MDTFEGRPPVQPVDYHDIVPGAHLGHYIVTEKIAQGGMGAVFKALEPALERYVAIKVLRPEFAENDAYVQYFQEEARAVAALRHPNIVPIYYIGVENRIAYFSMAYIEGETFDDWIDQSRRFSTNDAMWFMSQAVAALQCAADANIVHLDIKPANFLIDSNNTIMLTDFGLAQKMNRQDTEEREAFGTPAYVSPEQITRDKTDLRTDVYSLGASLFHLMVGDPPFDGNSVEDIVWGHLEKPFPAEKAQTAGVPEGWIYLIKKMMERRPEDRFQNYGELYEALGGVDHFIYETIRLTPPPPKPLVVPRRNVNRESLHGILTTTTQTWRSGSGASHAQVKQTREQVFEAIKERQEPLSISPMLGTLHDLCRPAEGDPDDMFDAFERVPGFYDAAARVAQFMATATGDEIHDAEDVLEVLGLVRARSLALSFFSLNFEWKPPSRFDWRPAWQHLIATGMLVDLMYDALDLRRSGFEYVCGLMHDLGKFILADLYPFGYVMCMENSIHEERPLAECEVEMFGIHHAQLFSIWAGDQGFPLGLCDVIGSHEAPENIKKKSILSHALVSANHLCKQLGIGYSGNACIDPRSWEELPSTAQIWENRRNQEYEYDDFTEGFSEQFRDFPDVV
jgi:serine/threonine protein kinase